MKDQTIKICITSLMSSMVLVATFIRIPVPVGDMNTMIHLGNVFCILSGLLLGPVQGGMSAGIGSFIFDVVSPGYITSAPFTFVFKFVMGFVCGLIAHKSKSRFTSLVAAACGTTSYVILHAAKNFLKNMFLLNIPLNANMIITAKGTVISIINAIMAVMIAVPLFEALKKNFLGKDLP